MREFILYPAIDLRLGQVVRLAQGDPQREQRYSCDPEAVSRRWLAEGAKWLHVVNLDGALGQRAERNLGALERILETGARVQFGGGLRGMDDIRAAFDAGVERVVLGTAAVETPELVDQALARYGPRRVALAIDTRDGQVRMRGWKEASALDPLELATEFAGAGGTHCVVTDIARDGMGMGLNLELAGRVQGWARLQVIASGGATGIRDVVDARQAGLAGVIIGRALYDGRIALAEALRC
jgi:phosphoribosylformimino-5-aminoimidazole carboxamide ribotide isomerase